jgi:lysophospholipid acyltransferase (LPLAT)-like uncharacterized protein
MPDDKNRYYQFADLSIYSFKERLTIRMVDWACFVMMNLIGMTIRFEVEGREKLDSIIASGKLPIWAFWHDRIFLSTYYFRGRGIVVITSKSRDGEYIARFIQRFGFGAIRGSSSRGAARALVEMRNAMRLGLETGFSVDGPKGPRYEAKHGPVYLAKLTGDPVLPFLFEARKYWTLNSWDRLQIPKPFTKALLIFSDPFTVGPDVDETELKNKASELQRSLDKLVERGRRWRKAEPLA